MLTKPNPPGPEGSGQFFVGLDDNSFVSVDVFQLMGHNILGIQHFRFDEISYILEANCWLYFRDLDTVYGRIMHLDFDQ